MSHEIQEILINYIAAVGILLGDSRVFTGSSRTVENNLFDAMLAACQTLIITAAYMLSEIIMILCYTYINL